MNQLAAAVVDLQLFRRASVADGGGRGPQHSTAKISALLTQILQLQYGHSTNRFWQQSIASMAATSRPAQFAGHFPATLTSGFDFQREISYSVLQ